MSKQEYLKHYPNAICKQIYAGSNLSPAYGIFNDGEEQFERWRIPETGKHNRPTVTRSTAWQAWEDGLKRLFANSRLVAVQDGAGKSATIGLYHEFEDDSVCPEEIPWPEDWPEWVSAKFVEAAGYEIVVA